MGGKPRPKKWLLRLDPEAGRAIYNALVRQWHAEPAVNDLIDTLHEKDKTILGGTK